MLYAKVSKNGEGAPDEDYGSIVYSYYWTTISIPARIHQLVGAHVLRLLVRRVSDSTANSPGNGDIFEEEALLEFLGKMQKKLGRPLINAVLPFQSQYDWRRICSVQ
jgi:hypothetical protein